MTILKVGALFRPSDERGWYRIQKLSDPCTCAPFIAVINNLGREDQIPPSPSHYHITARWAGAVFPPGSKPLSNNSYFNGYDANGRNVWREDDRLIVDGYEPGRIDDLFGAMG